MRSRTGSPGVDPPPSQPLHPAILHFGPSIQAKQHTLTAAMASRSATRQRTDQGDQAPAPPSLDLLELLRIGPIRLAFMSGLDQVARKRLRGASRAVQRSMEEGVISLGDFGGSKWWNHQDEALSLRSLSTRLTEVKTLKLESVEAMQVLSLHSTRLTRQQSSGEREANGARAYRRAPSSLLPCLSGFQVVRSRAPPTSPSWLRCT